MPPRLVLHAGFHKTGTTSVQQVLDLDRRQMRRVLRPLVKRDMAALCAATRAHGANPGPVSLSHVVYEAARLFEGLDAQDPRPVLLSSEDLSGAIPGRKGRCLYPSAPELLTTLVDTAAAVWSARPEVAIHFTTRAPQGWILSCHAQHLRADRFTMKEAEYTAWQADHADLSVPVAAVAAALPDAEVTALDLDAAQALPHGPLTPLLDHARVPPRVRARLRPIPHANRKLPADIRASLLDLNRSDLTEAELKRRKRALLASTVQDIPSEDR
ncbi:hypothetical protein [Pseudooceanicola sp. HF7]|uniref:hypothetical protein n=1 Tax=Pseudooceanicola sp. HF7 TaxID=2721560 RepID=UPI00142FABBA|nr:hypothetical protein [Pseudooceanicola sp. HF7]NIZ10746.1 hypothetical protein [Pseudooceanicola sp. HF7]